MGGDRHQGIGHKWDDDNGFCEAKQAEDMDEWGLMLRLNMKQYVCTEGYLL